MCEHCNSLIGGYSIIGIKRLKKQKIIICPWCGKHNKVTSEDHKRLITISIPQPSRKVYENMMIT